MTSKDKGLVIFIGEYGFDMTWQCLACKKDHRFKISEYKKPGIHKKSVKCGCGFKTKLPINVIYHE